MFHYESSEYLCKVIFLRWVIWVCSHEGVLDGGRFAASDRYSMASGSQSREATNHRQPPLS